MLRLRFKSLVLVFASLLVTISLPAYSGEAPLPYLITKNLSYGETGKTDREFQTLDVYWKDAAKQRPVVIYVHDGGWALGDKSDVHLKPEFFAHHDVAFISMNYRLRWEYGLYDQLEDIAKVVKWVKTHYKDYGLDPDKIVLMGYGAGAHLVSLVGTDEDIVHTQGLELSDIKAVVAIDSASFDIPLMMKRKDDFLVRRRHELIFGSDEKTWIAASPISHIEAGKKIPPFALLYVADSELTSLQARSFSKALRAAKVNVIMIPGNQKTADSIDEELGRAGDAPTLALIAFLRATF